MRNLFMKDNVVETHTIESVFCTFECFTRTAFLDSFFQFCFILIYNVYYIYVFRLQLDKETFKPVLSPT